VDTGRERATPLGYVAAWRNEGQRHCVREENVWNYGFDHVESFMFKSNCYGQIFSFLVAKAGTAGRAFSVTVCA